MQTGNIIAAYVEPGDILLDPNGQTIGEINDVSDHGDFIHLHLTGEDGKEVMEVEPFAPLNILISLYDSDETDAFIDV